MGRPWRRWRQRHVRAWERRRLSSPPWMDESSRRQGGRGARARWQSRRSSPVASACSSIRAISRPRRPNRSAAAAIWSARSAAAGLPAARQSRRSSPTRCTRRPWPPRPTCVRCSRASPAPPPAVWGDLLGESAAAVALRDDVHRAARAPFPVLVEGESGSGKELVARAIHKLSPRHTRRFCAINCAALGDDLIEAELFGHARGAFTGAATERAGLFEEADGGTLFLDEVGELSARAQAKLLRVLQEGEVRRVGENLPRRVDVRIVAATNRQLEREAAEGRFRVDLRFRLDVLRITVPALRERPGDVPLLAQHFWRAAADRVGSRAMLGPDALAALARYDWPGNVRELQNAIAWMAVHAPRRGRIGASSLPSHLASVPLATGSSFEMAREDFERRFVRAALAQAGGQRHVAAKALGVTRQGLVEDAAAAADRACGRLTEPRIALVSGADVRQVRPPSPVRRMSAGSGGLSGPGRPLGGGAWFAKAVGEVGDPACSLERPAVAGIEQRVVVDEGRARGSGVAQAFGRIRQPQKRRAVDRRLLASPVAACARRAAARRRRRAPRRAARAPRSWAPSRPRAAARRWPCRAPRCPAPSARRRATCVRARRRCRRDPGTARWHCRAGVPRASV